MINLSDYHCFKSNISHTEIRIDGSNENGTKRHKGLYVASMVYLVLHYMFTLRLRKFWHARKLRGTQASMWGWPWEPALMLNCWLCLPSCWNHLPIGVSSLGCARRSSNTNSTSLWGGSFAQMLDPATLGHMS